MDINDAKIETFIKSFLNDSDELDNLISHGFKPHEILRIGLGFSMKNMVKHSNTRKRMIERMNDLHSIGIKITIQRLRYKVELSQFNEEKPSRGRKYQESYDTAVNFYNAYREEIERLNEKLKDEN